MLASRLAATGTSAEQGMNASKCAAYNTYVVPRHRLSDNGGTHSQLIEDKLVVHWMMNATSEPMPADSHQVK